MSKKKYYAVRVGKSVGIFEDWSECQESINGYSNAEYKSFSAKEDAESYLKREDIAEKQKKFAQDSNSLIAYIDGSYSEEIARYSFACILITPDGEVNPHCGHGDDPNALKIRNVAGELQGAMFAVKWASENGYRKIIIRHDYEGISKWYSGEWKAKDAMVKKYLQFMENYKPLVDIQFEKVIAHSGDKYNEEADKLARSALKNSKKVSKGESWVTVEKIKFEDLKVIIDIIKQETDPISVEEIKQAYCIKYTVNQCNQDKLILKYFNDNEKLTIQGKPQKLFNIFLAYITELVEIDQIPKIYNEYCMLDVNKENVKTQYEGYLPNACKKLPSRLTRALQQAVYNLNIDGDMFDATFLVHPALRAFEGFIIMVLGNHKVTVSNGFDMFERKNNDTYRLKDSYTSNIGSQSKIRYLNRCYNFYHKNRHELFHWNDPCAAIDDTRMIGSINEAKKMITDTLQLVDEYYNIK